jgi:uncharacterized protein (DUF1697 family)
MSVFVVLLRAIGAGTHAIMSMAQWREAAAADGFADPETVLASGNMIVSAEDTPEGVAARMDRIVQGFGLTAMRKAVVRRPEDLVELVEADPFPDAARTRPSRMGVFFFAGPRPDFGWVSGYEGPERLSIVGSHLIVDYTRPISESGKLGPLIEKRSGTATARNWNTLAALARRAADRQKKA